MPTWYSPNCTALLLCLLCCRALRRSLARTCIRLLLWCRGLRQSLARTCIRLWLWSTWLGVGLLTRLRRNSCCGGSLLCLLRGLQDFMLSRLSTVCLFRSRWSRRGCRLCLVGSLQLSPLSMTRAGEGVGPGRAGQGCFLLLLLLLSLALSFDSLQMHVCVAAQMTMRLQCLMSACCMLHG